MSHYSEYPTNIKDLGFLLKALAEMGFTSEKVEVHDTPVHLFGYHGDRRKDTAHVVIRRKHVGASSNDIGFIRQEDGTFRAIISEFDRGSMRYNDAWLEKLQQNYTTIGVTEKLKAKGFSVFTKKTQDGEVHLNMRRN